MLIELTEAQCAELQRLLEGTLGDLSTEIADTDNAEYREGLRERRDRARVGPVPAGQPAAGQRLTRARPAAGVTPRRRSGSPGSARPTMSSTFVMTSPNASGSANIHEWVPGTVTTSGSPSGAAHVLERVPRDELVALSPTGRRREDARRRSASSSCRQVGPSGQSRRLPERLSGRAAGSPHDLGDDDGQDPARLAHGEQVGREVDAPVPQRPLRHGADRRARVGPGRATDRVDQHQGAHQVGMVVRQQRSPTPPPKECPMTNAGPRRRRPRGRQPPSPRSARRGGLARPARRPCPRTRAARAHRRARPARTRRESARL